MNSPCRMNLRKWFEHTTTAVPVVDVPVSSVGLGLAAGGAGWSVSVTREERAHAATRHATSRHCAVPLSSVASGHSAPQHVVVSCCVTMHQEMHCWTVTTINNNALLSQQCCVGGSSVIWFNCCERVPVAYCTSFKCVRRLHNVHQPSEKLQVVCT